MTRPEPTIEDIPEDERARMIVFRATHDEEGAGDHLDLIVTIDAYRATVPTSILWIAEPFVYAGGVTLLSGPPKGGKSTLVAQLQRARETRDDVFLGDHVVPGPVLLLTEESGVAVTYKADGLTKLYVLDRRTVVQAELSWSDILGLVQRWCDARAEEDELHPPLVIVDTLAVWAGIKDENDASEATQALAAVMVLAANTGAGVIVVHHSRKGGGKDGEAIRGSSAILATPDVAAELSVASEGSDDRWLDLRGRVIHPTRLRLAFDRDTNAYSLVDQAVIHRSELTKAVSKVPADGPGLSRTELRELWGRDPRHLIAQLLDTCLLRELFVLEGRTRKTRYWRVVHGAFGPDEEAESDD